MEYTVSKVQKRSAEVQAAEVLREAIISGGIPLGARLTEISAAEQLGVARSTIRTALHQLVQDGLVVQIPYTGWTVMTLSSHDAWELYTLRVGLETLAAGLVADKIASGQGADAMRESLTNAFAALKSACQTRDSAIIAAADMALHKCIILMSGHRRLAEQYGRIEHQVLIYIRSSDALVAEPDQIIRQHQPLIDALLGGDRAAAVSALASHIEDEGAILVEHLKKTG
jgi:DNA-binding GntR family transcriptional regulator